MRLTPKPGTGGRAAAVAGGASFSFVLLWLFGGGSFSLVSTSGTSSCFCAASLARRGGVDATTSGSMVEMEGSGAGSGREGWGKSVWTIWHGRQCRWGCMGEVEQAYIVQSLQDALQHPRPFGAVQRVSLWRSADQKGPYMSMEPSRAASSNICSGESISTVLACLAQRLSFDMIDLGMG